MPELDRLKPELIVITGPTGSGKSDLSLQLAQHIGCDIISADSRQLFHEIPIGTAAPDPAMLAAVKHYFVGTLALGDYYSAARYEEEVMELLPRLWEHNRRVIMCGGSMMYIDAVTRGIDELPTVSDQVRRDVAAIYHDEGLEGLRRRLRILDPEYLAIADPANHRRLIHAVEICLEAGVPYTSLRTGKAKERPFKVTKMMIDYRRDELFDRINRRVQKMVDDGLIEEARRVYALRHLNSLNTVGYKELFAWFDGSLDRETAIARIAKNTRVYAKKQLTWLKRDPSVIKLRPETALADALAVLGDDR